MNRIYKLLLWGLLTSFLLFFGVSFKDIGAHEKKTKTKSQTRKSKTSIQKDQTLYVKVKNANLRANPVIKLENIIDTLPQHTPVTFLRSEEDWYLVMLADGRIGWMAASVLTTQKVESKEKPAPVEEPQPQAKTKTEEVSEPPLPVERSEEEFSMPQPSQQAIPIQIETKSPAGNRVPQDMVFIPPGQTIIGSNEEEINKIAQRQGVDLAELEDEKPRRQVFVKGFFIDKYEVTNAQYKKFIEATGRRPPLNWEGDIYPAGRDNHPVVYVSWEDAKRYCEWAGKRLPTAEEWEKAARGPEGKLYPWGDEYGAEKVNLVNTGRGSTAPVGEYQGDKSPYEVYDMGGNVSEWTSSWYDGDRDSYILKGGSWYSNLYAARGAQRSIGIPDYKLDIAGFRCAKDL